PLVRYHFPTRRYSYLYQVEILDLLTDINRKHGTTIVMVLHDINLSARYADHIFALHDGKLIAEGEPLNVITSTLVKDIFGLECIDRKSTRLNSSHVAI